MNVRQIWGAVRTFFYLRSPKVQIVISVIAQEIVERMEDCLHERTLVIMTGMSLSGKTTYVASQLKEFGQISTREIHDLLNRSLDFLRDDNSVRGQAYWVRQFLTEAVREEALHGALDCGVALVLDSCHLTRKKRLARYRVAKRYGYRVVIVFADCPWPTLLTRAQAADEESVAQGRKRVWEELIRQQTRVFEHPTSAEADQLVFSWS